MATKKLNKPKDIFLYLMYVVLDIWCMLVLSIQMLSYFLMYI
jgi:hypothetical protein